MAKSKKILIYIIHGYFSSARKMREVAALAQKTYPDADVINETSPLRWPYSLRRAPSLVLSHISRIDQLTAKKKYDQIFLLGHSAGGLLAQPALLFQSLDQVRMPLAQLGLPPSQSIVLIIGYGWLTGIVVELVVPSKLSG